MSEQSSGINERALLSQNNVAQPVSVLQIRALNKKLAKNAPTLELTPPGTRKKGNPELCREITARILEIRKRLSTRKTLAKQAFRRASR